MEVRHEDLAKDVATLTATTAQVVQNQKHAEELNELRFKSLDQHVGSLGSDLKGFMNRMEGIMTGDIKTAAARDLEEAKAVAERDGGKIMAEWTEWRRDTDRRLDGQDLRNARGEGIFMTLGGAKGVAIMLAAIASPVITVIALIVKH